MVRIVDTPALVLDACCLINLSVTGRLRDIVGCLGVRVLAAELVWLEEVPSLRAAGDSDLDVVLSARVIELAEFEGGEADDFVEFAAELGDDGEAATCAIAFRRGFAVATDDRAATRFVQRHSPGTRIVTSPKLLHHWAERAQPSRDELREALTRVRDIGRYVPGPVHPLTEWWRTIVE